MANRADRVAGVLGYFPNPHALVAGMEKVRTSGYQSFDAFTPFPVHGLDAAQGLKRSFLPYITFVMGLAGFVTAFSLQYWTSAVDWPINVSGKPFNSWPAFVPIMFELTVLFAGVSTAIGMLLINRLPNTTRASFDPALTCDRFAILIENPNLSDDHGDESSPFKKFSETDAGQFLRSVGATEVRTVYEKGWF